MLCNQENSRITNDKKELKQIKEITLKRVKTNSMHRGTLEQIQ